MAYQAMKPTKPGLEEPQEVVHRIRITLSSKNVKNLEKGLLFRLCLCFGAFVHAVLFCFVFLFLL